MNAGTVERGDRLALLDSQRRVLERIASGAPLAEVLDTLIKLIEQQAPGMRCAVLLADAERKRLAFVAAPSIPQDYKTGIEPFLSIEPNMGSCGTAAHLREPVYTEDTATDPRWARCRDLALRNGLRAIWSTPILSDDNAVLGTFAMYYGEPRLPAPEHIQLIDMATQMARVAMQSKQDEELLRTIVEHAPAGIAIADFEHRLIRANPAFSRLIGYGADELKGMPIAHFTHEEDWPRNNALFDELFSGERGPLGLEKRYRRKDGTLVWVHVTVTLVRGPRDEPRYTVALIEDVTDRRRADDALRQSADELQALSRRLVELQESERRELARELHDRVGQSLTGLNINLGILKSRLATHENADLKSRLDDSVALLESTARAIAQVAADLRPPMLDDHGLPTTLEWYAKQFAARTGVRVAVIFAEPRGTVSTDVQIALFRIAQEALNNVAKHARATSVRIELESPAAEYVMSISDDGVGFDASAISASNRARSGLGMVTMRERAQAIGGRFRVKSLPGGGTQLTVRVPR